MKLKIKLAFCGLVIAGAVSASIPDQNKPLSCWSFEELEKQEEIIPIKRRGRLELEIYRVFSVIDNVGNEKDQVFGSWFKLAPGIKGNAIQLDGNTSYVLRKGNKVPEVSGNFSVTAWISLAAYPVNWCPVVDHSTLSDKGYFLGVDAYGRAGFNIKAGGGVDTSTFKRENTLAKVVSYSRCVRSG